MTIYSTPNSEVSRIARFLESVDIPYETKDEGYKSWNETPLTTVIFEGNLLDSLGILKIREWAQLPIEPVTSRNQ